MQSKTRACDGRRRTLHTSSHPIGDGVYYTERRRTPLRDHKLYLHVIGMVN